MTSIPHQTDSGSLSHQWSLLWRFEVRKYAVTIRCRLVVHNKVSNESKTSLVSCTNCHEDLTYAYSPCIYLKQKFNCCALVISLIQVSFTPPQTVANQRTCFTMEFLRENCSLLLDWYSFFNVRWPKIMSRWHGRDPISSCTLCSIAAILRSLELI